MQKDLCSEAPLFLWGKVRGTVRDYFVVYNIEKGETAQVPCKNFFWCSSLNFVFSSLPRIGCPKSIARLLKERSLFSGEFDCVIVQSSDPPRVIDAEAGIILPPKHLTELDRLAVTVREIDRACSCVPRGTLKFTPLQEVTSNEGFKGLSKDEAFNLANWQHFRRVETEDKKDLVLRNEAVYNPDFLDAVDGDKPNHCWSVIPDATGTVATLRS